MKRLFTLLTLVLSFQFAFAQYGRPNNQYYIDPKLINPAFAAVLNDQNYQVQYGGINQSSQDFPFSLLAGFSLPVPKINSGIGGFVWKTRQEPVTEVGGSFVYNYKFTLGEKRSISLGTEVSFSKREVDFSKYIVIESNDPLVALSKNDYNASNASFGVVYRDRSFFISATIDNFTLYQSSKDFYGGSSVDKKRYTIYMSYEFPLSPSFRLRPSVRYFTDLTQYQIDLNAFLYWKERIIVGSSTEIGITTAYEKISAGIVLHKNFQLVGTIYSQSNHRFYATSNNAEVMLRVVLKERSDRVANPK